LPLCRPAMMTICCSPKNETVLNWVRCAPFWEAGLRRTGCSSAVHFVEIGLYDWQVHTWMLWEFHAAHSSTKSLIVGRGKGCHLMLILRHTIIHKQPSSAMRRPVSHSSLSLIHRPSGSCREFVQRQIEVRILH